MMCYFGVVSTAIVWFRRDLRVHDHPGLTRALSEFDHVVPAFVLDPVLTRGRYRSDRRTGFLFRCLRDLDRSLRKLESGLILLAGEPETRLAELGTRVGAEAAFWTSDVSPYARERDRRVTEALREASIRACPQTGNYVAPIGKLVTTSGNPYRVFSPFHRRWLDSPRREVLPAPHRIGPLPSEAAGLGFREQAGRFTPADPVDGARDLVAAGESPARKALAAWLDSGLAEYGKQHDHVADPESTSALSPYLRWGCLSPAEAEQQALRTDTKGAAAWTRQLCWRDFHAHVLLHWPENLKREFQPALRQIEWEADPDRLAGWQEGMTGYPIIDAAMRQLAETGWMHNRARLIAGSFLTKDLQLDWREGERWFARHLLDGEPAQNNGNWQWIASVGTDPAPLTRRLYNPVKQSERHDPEGAYIRRWVPELADVPVKAIHAPWTMDESQQRKSGCRIGRDYPEPLVEHAFERQIALERYGRARDLASNASPTGAR